MGAKLVHFKLLFLMCAFKGENFFLRFWSVASLASFRSSYLVIQIVVRFGDSVGVYFVRSVQQNFLLILSLDASSSAIRTENILYRLSRL